MAVMPAVSEYNMCVRITQCIHSNTAAAKRTRRLPHHQSTYCSSGSTFDEWLAANQLPGYQARPNSSISSGQAGSSTPGAGAGQLLEVQRFHWTEAPGVAAHCLRAYRHLVWELEAPGILLASRSSGSSGACAVSGGSGDSGSMQAVARLMLPRVLAGSHPALFPSSQRREASPLTLLPGAEQQRLLLALESLSLFTPSTPPNHPQSSNNSSTHISNIRSVAPISSSGGNPETFRIGNQLIVLLSADSAALGLCAEGCLVRHKVLTGYTVRKNQGKAQATYERQGGGARSVGGSIRARETRRLFQNAAATLADWQADIASCSQLFSSGTVRVWNELYGSTSPPVPVDRWDPRWQSVGMGVRRPRLADVERVLAALSHGMLSLSADGVVEMEEQL